MRKLLGWTLVGVILFTATSFVVDVNGFWLRLTSSLLLMATALLAGIRIGADSAAKYTKDLQRLNKVIVDQNERLLDANAMLLSKVGEEIRSRTKRT